MSKRKYYVKVGNMYFRYWYTGIYPVFVVNDQPGAKGVAIQLVKEEAERVAEVIEGEIEPVERLYKMPVPYLNRKETGCLWGYRKTGDGEVILDNIQTVTKYSLFTWVEIEVLFPDIYHWAIEVD